MGPHAATMKSSGGGEKGNLPTLFPDSKSIKRVVGLNLVRDAQVLLCVRGAPEVTQEDRHRHVRGSDANLGMGVAGMRAAPWGWCGDRVAVFVLGIVVHFECFGDASGLMTFVHDSGFCVSAYESDVAYGHERDPVRVGVHGYLSLSPNLEPSRQELCSRLELTCLACQDEWVRVWCEQGAFELISGLAS